MIKRLAIIGASGHGKVVADIARASDIIDIVFYDDQYKELKKHYGCRVVGSVEDALVDATKYYDAAVVAIGKSSIRAAVQQRIERLAPPLIHPTATVSASSKIGAGTVVMPHAVISADVAIGKGVIINSSAIVEHDCKIGDFAHICPNAALAGGVIVGDHSWIGISSSVIQLISIGRNVTVGAGSVVVSNITDGLTVVGSPATAVKR